MRFYIKRTLLVMLFNISLVNAQNPSEMKMRTELESKNKTELVQIAFDILKEKQPSLVLDSDDFESSVWGNSKEIIVKFRRYIQFVPLQKPPHYHYDVTVDLITKQILPFDYGCDVNFYIPSEQDKKKLDFIKEKADFPKQSDVDITITENEENYWVSKKSKTAFSKFFINKKTRAKSGVMEGSFSVNQVKPVLESIHEREKMVEIFDNDNLVKKDIVKMAVTLLKKKQPSLTINLDDYESSVLGDSKNTLVQFRRIIRYIPLGTNPEKRISYDIKVNLNTNEISPFDDAFESEFYIETEEDKKALAFIKKNFRPLLPDSENTIKEGKEDYFIKCFSKYSLEEYVLNKETGKEKQELKWSLDPAPIPKKASDTDNHSEIK